MVVCLNWTISWQERLFTAAATCWKRCIQRVRQITAVQEQSNTKETVNQKAAQLLEIYGDSILRMAYSYLHNMSDAEDILQETLIRYLQTMPELENASHEKAWLLKVAANLSKNRIDYNRVRQTDELEESLVAEKRLSICFITRGIPQHRLHRFWKPGKQRCVPICGGAGCN